MASIPIEQHNPTASTIGDVELPTPLVCVSALSPNSFAATLAHISAAFADRPVLVAAPEQPVGELNLPLPDNIQLLRPTAEAAARPDGWVLTAADFTGAYTLATQHNTAGCLLLGGESQSLSVEALRALHQALLSGADLSVPRYHVGPREGLVNSAILHPVNRAVFGTPARFPLAPDLGVSLRMAQRMATAAGRFIQSGQSDALLWPLSEAAVAGYAVTEVTVADRLLPTPAALDLNTLLGNITGSLFAEIDARAAFWQRTRLAPRQAVEEAHTPEQTVPVDTRPMQDAFRLAHKNLAEIWSLVLPPNSLLGLKRLSQAQPEDFRMPDALWARIVYDFLLAFRLRTINRGHLLGALTPLYLAWVASHLELIGTGVASEQHIEQQAQAFEFDKPYLVSRWRWPDRFNP